MPVPTAEEYKKLYAKELKVISHQGGRKAKSLSQMITENDVIEKEIARKRMLIQQLEDLEWTERSAAHKERMHKLAVEAIANSKIAPPKTWRDLQIVDKLARTALGEDDSGFMGTGNRGIKVGVLSSFALKHERPVVDAGPDAVVVHDLEDSGSP